MDLDDGRHRDIFALVLPLISQRELTSHGPNASATNLLRREAGRRVDAVYDIAMTVSACLQSGTRADVAWLIDSDGLPVSDPSSAVVFTPGGGKIGQLVGGALDGQLGDLVGRANVGRLLELEVSQVDALIAELPSAGSARCLLVPADTMPSGVWDLARERQPFALVVRLDGEEVSTIDVLAGAEIEDVVRESDSAEGRIVSVFSATTRVVVVGGGPVAEAVVGLVEHLGWDARTAEDTSTVTGLIAPLSARDVVVVAAHDLELAGAALTAALESACGYLGSVGSRKMQADRADWLAYRGVTDLSRIHGPAGLDIGADTPGEIAVAIVAEAIAVRSGG